MIFCYLLYKLFDMSSKRTRKVGNHKWSNHPIVEKKTSTGKEWKIVSLIDDLEKLSLSDIRYQDDTTLTAIMKNSNISNVKKNKAKKYLTSNVWRSKGSRGGKTRRKKRKKRK